MKFLLFAGLVTPLAAQITTGDNPAPESHAKDDNSVEYQSKDKVGKEVWDRMLKSTTIDSVDSQGPDSVRGKGGRIQPQAWPDEKAFIEDKSLPFDVGTPGYGDFRDANARICYAFKVEPGEKLEFNMKAEEEKVVMRAYVPNPPPTLKWKLELDYVNRIARPRRSKHIEIKNSTSEPQTLFLVLYGVHGYAYRLDMTRSGGHRAS